MIRIHIDPKLRSIFALLELQYRRFLRDTINPMAPQLPEIIHRIAELESKS